MSAETAVSGLCVCCTHAPACSLPRDPRSPVFFCEEFEVVRPEPGTQRRAKPSSGSSRGTPASPATARPVSYDKGLCSDCANGPTCTFPKLEGGVWRCEEYR